MSQLNRGEALWSVVQFPPSHTSPKRIRPLGNLPHSPTSSALTQGTLGILTGVVFTCCSPLVARWARGDWVSMSLVLSSHWTLDQFSTPTNHGRLAMFLQAGFEKLEPVSHPRHLLFRTSVLLHPFSLVFQTCAPGRWSQVPASRSNSQEIKALPL